MYRACFLAIAAVLVAASQLQAKAGEEPQENIPGRVDTSGPLPGVPIRARPLLPAGTDVAVGKWPSELVIAGHDAWVLNTGADSVSIVDLATEGVVASFGVLNESGTISISADGSTVFVVGFEKPTPPPGSMCEYSVIDHQNGALTLFDTASRTLRGTIPVTHEPFLAVPSSDGLVYVATLSGPVHQIDPTAGRVLATYPMGVTQLEDLVVSRDGKKLFAVAGPVLDGILVVDTATGALRTIRLDSSGLSIFFGGRIAIDPSGNFLFVNVLDPYNNQAAAVISTTEERVLAVIPRGFWGLTFSKDGRRAYLLDPEWDWRRGLVVSLPSLEITSQLPIGGAGAVLSADGTTLFFTRFGTAFRRGIEMGPGYEERYDVGALHLPSGLLRGVDVSPALISCSFERGLGLTADGRYLVVANPALDNVTIFDLARSPLK